MKTTSKTAAIVTLFALALLLAFTPANDKKRIVIDAGHGGHDTGKVLDDHKESAISLQIAKKVQQLGAQKGIEVILLREEDQFIALADRAKTINELQPDMFISIHINNYKDKEKQLGNKIFVDGKERTKEKSTLLAGNLAASFAAHTAFGTSKIEVQNFALLRLTEVPGVLLNMGNMTNDQERTYVASAAGQQEIATSIVAALLN